MQLNIEYAQITNQIFHSFLSTVQFQMPIAHSVFNRLFAMSVPSSCSNTRIEICCKMIQLPYQRTREANHSVSSTKRSFTSALRWPTLACVFDSVPA